MFADVGAPDRAADEALKRFNAWVKDPEGSPIHPSLRAPVWRAAVRKEGARAVDILKKEWFNTKSIDGKLICLQALSATEDKEVLGRSIIPFNFNTSPPNDAVPAADMHALGMGLANNPEGRRLQWEYMKKNWETCGAKLGNPIVMDRFVRVTLGGFTDAEAAEDIDQFFKDKDTSSFNRTLGTVKDKIRGRAAYKKRDSGALKEWLSANGYM